MTQICLSLGGAMEERAAMSAFYVNSVRFTEGRSLPKSVPYIMLIGPFATRKIGGRAQISTEEGNNFH